jgi:alpha-tubulin suppressor-like RCC1 family protein
MIPFASFPVQVLGLDHVVTLATGSYHVLALRSDGSMWAWGDDQLGQLGDGTNGFRYTPVPVAGLTDVVALSAGRAHSLAVRADGSTWAWGGNDAAQIGDGVTVNEPTPHRTLLPCRFVGMPSREHRAGEPRSCQAEP